MYSAQVIQDTNNQIEPLLINNIAEGTFTVMLHKCFCCAPFTAQSFVQQRYQCDQYREVYYSFLCVGRERSNGHLHLL